VLGSGFFRPSGTGLRKRFVVVTNEVTRLRVSNTRGGSCIRESRTYGFERGAHSNMRPYRDPYLTHVLLERDDLGDLDEFRRIPSAVAGRGQRDSVRTRGKLFAEHDHTIEDIDVLRSGLH
jgi:hypothetical protein